MLGVILCGGRSTRMGTDKGLLQTREQHWAQLAADKMKLLSLPVLLSVNENQYADYAAIFKPDQLIKDNETLAVKGPLCGVLSVHLQYPQEDLFVLACDMPLMDMAVLNDLANICKKNVLSAGAFVYTNETEPEPLCAIYTAKALQYVHGLLNNNQLARHSMKFVLEHVHTLSTPLQEEQKKYFRNFNSHADLNGL